MHTAKNMKRAAMEREGSGSENPRAETALGTYRKWLCRYKRSALGATRTAAQASGAGGWWWAKAATAQRTQWWRTWWQSPVRPSANRAASTHESCSNPNENMAMNSSVAKQDKISCLLTCENMLWQPVKCFGYAYLGYTKSLKQYCHRPMFLKLLCVSSYDSIQ